MKCPQCNEIAQKFGKNRNNTQRFRCLSCGKTFSESPTQSVKRPTQSTDKTPESVNSLSTATSIFDSFLVFSSPTPKNLPVRNLDFLTPQELYEQKREVAIRKVAEKDNSAVLMERDDIDYSIGDKDP